MISRERPTEDDCSEALSWHVTRLNTAKRPLFRDIEHFRERVGQGAFGTVYKSVEEAQGYNIAIKVIHLDKYGDVEAARALVHREIKVMEGLQHVGLVMLAFEDILLLLLHVVR
jgi:hypothetical protein